MNLLEIKELVEKEFLQKNVSTTADLLSKYKPIYQKEKLVFNRVDNKKPGNIVTAYLPIQDKSFYFAVSVDIESKKVISFSTEGHHLLYFRATSIFQNADQLKAYTTLPLSSSWSKGDKNPNGNFDYFFSAITIESTKDADHLEDKLEQLISTLEDDKMGITNLSSQSKTFIKILSTFGTHEEEITSFSLPKELMLRIVELGIELDFQIHIS